MIYSSKKKKINKCDRVFHSSGSWGMKAPLLRAVLSGCPQNRSSEDVKPPGGDRATYLCVCSCCCRQLQQDDPGPPGSSSPSCFTSSAANPDARARCPSLDCYSVEPCCSMLLSLFLIITCVNCISLGILQIFVYKLKLLTSKHG